MTRLARTPRLIASLVVAVIVASSTNAAVPAAVAAADPVVVAAGDIGDCTTTADTATSRLLDAIPGTVAVLGDIAYPDGSTANFRDCYDPAWGRHRSRTRPAPGNHEYRADDARPYFAYFGSAAGSPGSGWYSYDLGSWHVVVLNSNCAEIGGCSHGSRQVQWLRDDLAAHAAANVLAYWHHPRFSSGTHGTNTGVQAFWDVLYAAGADVVLTGHDHDYERFAPQDPSGVADPTRGIRQFVVGTGGTHLRPRATTARNSEIFSATHGVLRLTLGTDRYAWSFVPIAGSTFTDEGVTRTHTAPTVIRRAFSAISDAYVDQARPSTRFGHATRLAADGNTGHGLDRQTYLKFRVVGLSGTVERAAVRLWITNSTRDGPRIRPTTTSWSGKTLTWRNRPPATGPTLDDAARLRAGTWADFDVTDSVRGDGVVAFVLRPTSGDGVTMSSMQGSRPPRLVIQTAP